MADPAFYEPEEDDLLSSLAAPQFAGPDAGSYEDEYKRMQELERHAYAQHGESGSVDGELGVQLEMVHGDVKRVRMKVSYFAFWARCGGRGIRIAMSLRMSRDDSILRR